MEKRLSSAVATALILVAAYFFLYQAVQFNLAVTASAVPDSVTVIVDAGHGGEDGGTSTVDGVRECDLNLAIALRLEQLLALCGQPVEMIRRTDTAIYSEGAGTISEKKTSDLKNRAALVNAAPRAILVSIHQNHFPEDRYDGAQVFYAGTDGSEALAKLAQSTLRAALDPENDRQVKPGDAIYLLEAIDCPGILVECGFLSNAAEARRLQEPVYQQKIACAISSAVIRYLESEAQAYESENNVLLYCLRQ